MDNPEKMNQEMKNKEIKKYYSPIKPYATRKKRHLGFKIVKSIVKLLYPKYKFIWLTERPTEPVAYVSNHTKVNAPLAWILRYDRPIRTWSVSNMLWLKEAIIQFKKIINAEYKHPKLLYPLAYMVAPLAVWAFRGLEPIPVYYFSLAIRTTYQKTVETLQGGFDFITYAERPHVPVSKYVNEIEPGFFFSAKYYYDQTGKLLKFYPSYCAPSIKTIVIGNPYTYDPNKNLKDQMKEIKKYIEQEITRIAETLPPHKVETMNTNNDPVPENDIHDRNK